MPIGFVILDDEDVDAYVNAWKDDRWWPAIEKAHRLLSLAVPGYRPVQIKEKFGDLRYYFSIGDGVDENWRKIGDAIVAQAELEARQIDERIKQEALRDQGFVAAVTKRLAEEQAERERRWAERKAAQEAKEQEA